MIFKPCRAPHLIRPTFFRFHLIFSNMSLNDTNGKAPVQERQQQPRDMNRGLVKVQPARLDDLQPRYASTIQHEQENSDAHGWYAKLSKRACLKTSNRVHN